MALDILRKTVGTFFARAGRDNSGVVAVLFAISAVPLLIGIGAGVDCDGQILVGYDIVGLTPGRRPSFSRDFLAGQGSLAAAVAAYVAAVRDGSFPALGEGG